MFQIASARSPGIGLHYGYRRMSWPCVSPPTYAQISLAVSHVVIINGHGGNDFLKDREKALTQAIGTPAFFAVPLEGDGIVHPRFGWVRCLHADPGEHSLAAHLGLPNEARLRTVISVAAKNPGEAPGPLEAAGSGLGWYVLYGGPRFEALRKPEYELVRTAEDFLENPKIIGDSDIGRRLYIKHLERTIRSIRQFIEQTDRARKT
jgi:hypothetical protein